MMKNNQLLLLLAFLLTPSFFAGKANADDMSAPPACPTGIPSKSLNDLLSVSGAQASGDPANPNSSLIHGIVDAESSSIGAIKNQRSVTDKWIALARMLNDLGYLSEAHNAIAKAVPLIPLPASQNMMDGDLLALQNSIKFIVEAGDNSDALALIAKTSGHNRLFALQAYGEGQANQHNIPAAQATIDVIATEASTLSPEDNSPRTPLNAMGWDSSHPCSWSIERIRRSIANPAPRIVQRAQNTGDEISVNHYSNINVVLEQARRGDAAALHQTLPSVIAEAQKRPELSIKSILELAYALGQYGFIDEGKAVLAVGEEMAKTTPSLDWQKADYVTAIKKAHRSLGDSDKYAALNPAYPSTIPDLLKLIEATTPPGFNPDDIKYTPESQNDLSVVVAASAARSSQNEEDNDKSDAANALAKKHKLIEALQTIQSMHATQARNNALANIVHIVAKTGDYEQAFEIAKAINIGSPYDRASAMNSVLFAMVTYAPATASPPASVISPATRVANTPPPPNFSSPNMATLAAHQQQNPSARQAGAGSLPTSQQISSEEMVYHGNNSCIRFIGCVDGSDTVKIENSILTHQHIANAEIGTHSSCSSGVKFAGGGFLIDGTAVQANQAVKVGITSIGSYIVVAGRGIVKPSDSKTLLIDDTRIPAAATYVIDLCAQPAQ